MPNQYSYLGENDPELVGRDMKSYLEIMKKYDLNANALISFGIALFRLDLNALKSMFGVLSDRQKAGLFEMPINIGRFYRSGAPAYYSFSGSNPLDFLNTYKSSMNEDPTDSDLIESISKIIEIESYLFSQLEGTTLATLAKGKPSEIIPTEAVRHIAKFLDPLTREILRGVTKKMGSKEVKDELSIDPNKEPGGAAPKKTQ